MTCPICDCPICKGTGLVQIPSASGTPAIICPICQGIGYITVDKIATTA